MMIAASEAREAEKEARNQRLSLTYLLRADESKVTSPSTTVHVRRIMRAATDKSVVYDELLREQETQRLFSEGVLYFARLDH
jgi:hypothetical protein